MRISELEDADVAGIEEFYAHWKRAGGFLEDAASTGSAIGSTIRSGSWQAESGEKAAVAADGMVTQLRAGETQAESVGWLLWRAANYIRNAQGRLAALLEVVRADARFRVDDTGLVTAEPPSMSDMVSGSPSLMEYIQLVAQARRYTMAIRTVLSDTDTADERISAALRKAVDDGATGPPRFNGDAPRDGALDLTDLAKGPILWYLSIAGQMGAGTPEQQSADLGRMAKEEIERAGGECRMVQGMMTCVGAPTHMWERGGTTIGDTFIAPDGSFEEFHRRGDTKLRELMNHEKYHRDHQWRVHGAKFGLMYLAVEPLPGTNPYEWDAEQKGGKTGYDPPPEFRLPWPPLRNPVGPP